MAVERINVHDFNHEELQSALNRYMEGKYGKIDKAFFQQIGKGIRSRGFLTAVDLFCVICWKQWSYSKALDMAFESVTRDSEEKTRRCTKEAIELADKDAVAKAIEMLTQYSNKLYGVGVRTGSAILTFYDPEKYPVVDIHSWKALYGKQLEEDGPTPEEYAKYAQDVESIAKKCMMTAHEVDAALWVIGGGKP
jgi:hypothetical protein